MFRPTLALELDPRAGPVRRKNESMTRILNGSWSRRLDVCAAERGLPVCGCLNLTGDTGASVVAEPGANATLVVRSLDQVVRFGALALLLVIIAVVCAGVVARYFFNASFTWTEEFGSLAFIWLTFVGMAAGHRDEQHVAISLFEGNRDGLVHAARRVLTDLVVAYTTLWLFYGGLELVESIGGTSPALGWSNAIKYIVVPAGCLISLAYIVLADGTLPRIVRSSATVAFAWITLGILQDGIGQLISTTSPSLIMTIVFLACLIVGIPIAFSMLFCVFIATQGTHILPVAAIVHTAVGGASSFVLLAIPFFLTVGFLMNSGGLSARVIDFAASPRPMCSTAPCSEESAAPRARTRPVRPRYSSPR